MNRAKSTLNQYRKGEAIMKHATHCWFTRVQYLVVTLLLSVSLFLIAGTVMAQEAKVTSLMSKDLTEFPARNF